MLGCSPLLLSLYPVMYWYMGMGMSFCELGVCGMGMSFCELGVCGLGMK